MSELVDSDVVFRGMATCEDSDGSRVAEYFIVPRRKGGFVMFSVTPALSFAPYIRPAPRSEAGSAKPIEFTGSIQLPSRVGESLNGPSHPPRLIAQ
jgi:hypothetical protein